MFSNEINCINISLSTQGESWITSLMFLLKSMIWVSLWGSDNTVGNILQNGPNCLHCQCHESLKKSEKLIESRGTAKVRATSLCHKALNGHNWWSLSRVSLLYSVYRAVLISSWWPLKFGSAENSLVYRKPTPKYPRILRHGVDNLL